MKYDYFKKTPNRDLELVISKTIISFIKNDKPDECPKFGRKMVEKNIDMKKKK